jgi:DNA-binding transcriptional ArsR family regulator
MQTAIVSDDRLSRTFAALADPTRRAILGRLAQGDATVSELAAPHDLNLATISRHLQVLERAELVIKSRSAQWRMCHLNPAPLQAAEDWMAPYRSFFSERLARLQHQLEGQADRGEG